MTHDEEVPSLLNPDVPQWNKMLLGEFHAALEKNPSADLLSMFTEQYRREHRLAQFTKLSKAGKINMKTLDDLCADFQSDPNIDLLSAFPRDYTRRITFATGPKVTLREEDEKSVVTDLISDFRSKLEDANTATVMFPLSERVQDLLPPCADRADTDTQKQSLLTAVKLLIWNSPKLWECHVRGIVVKCSEDIVAKVITGNEDCTEYTSLEYLAEKAPDIPAPRPHGFISLGEFRVIFMSYIPGVTLKKAWPNLSPLQKSSIQQQLDDMFARLRALPMDRGHMLGGVCGEGAKELRVDECALHKGIATTAQYSDLQFSARHHGSKTYAKFLRSFVDHNESLLPGEPVFTHGDVRPDNIMVDTSLDDCEAPVTGIIDWEDSGFYPDYYECTATTRTLSVVDEDDWYLYLPASISPWRFPQRWLVDRLWGMHLRTS